MNGRMDPRGKTFGRLTVIDRAANDRFGRTQWHCRCACGAERVVALFRMTSGHTQSCGCIKGEKRKTHGMTRSPTYVSWLAMKQRCFYPGSAFYDRYGARGIRVCDRWNTSFEAFLQDMGERPTGHTIERIDPDGHYEPGNCRWASAGEQARNRSSTILVERDGETLCVLDWCEVLGLNPDVVYGRIRRGKSPVEALR